MAQSSKYAPVAQDLDGQVKNGSNPTSRIPCYVLLMLTAIYALRSIETLDPDPVDRETSWIS